VVGRGVALLSVLGMFDTISHHGIYVLDQDEALDFCVVGGQGERCLTRH
jgi:hypothetical protein